MDDALLVLMKLVLILLLFWLFVRLVILLSCMYNWYSLLGRVLIPRALCRWRHSRRVEVRRPVIGSIHVHCRSGLSGQSPFSWRKSTTCAVMQAIRYNFLRWLFFSYEILLCYTLFLFIYSTLHLFYLLYSDVCTKVRSNCSRMDNWLNHESSYSRTFAKCQNDWRVVAWMMR